VRGAKIEALRRDSRGDYRLSRDGRTFDRRRKLLYLKAASYEFLVTIRRRFTSSAARRTSGASHYSIV
jgi:hypothetical protein